MIRILTLCVCGLMLVGCNEGVQRGEFTVSSSRGYSLTGQSGKLILLHGDKLPERDREIVVLGVVFIDPHQLTVNRGGTTKHARMKSEFDIAEYRESGSKIVCNWDRGTGEVSFGKDAYNRSDGQVFVVIVDDEGELEVSQIQVAGDSPTPDQILDGARQALPVILEDTGVADGAGSE